jgi:hypothetical protein
MPLCYPLQVPLRGSISSKGQRCIQGDGHRGRQQRYFKQ